MPATPNSRINGITTSVAVKAPCLVATSAPITLSGLQTISGQAVTADDRVLVKNQTDTTENGIYYPSTGAWERAPDFDGNLDAVNGTRILVGTDVVYATVCADGPVTFGTSAITFALAGIGDGSGVGIINFVTAANVGGTANAITLSPLTPPVGYASGLTYSFVAEGNNTGAVTVNVSGFGAAALRTKEGVAMTGGELVSGLVCFIEYNGDTSSFHMLNSQSPRYVATVGGSANAITLSPSPAITAYTAGLTYTFIAAANNSAATTMNISGVSAVSLRTKEGDAMTGGEVAIGGIYIVQYNSVTGFFHLVNSGRNLSGTFTPALAFGGNSVGIVYGARFGQYKVVGSIVFFWLQVTLTNKGSSTGFATITNLPFTVSGSVGSTGNIPGGIVNPSQITFADKYLTICPNQNTATASLASAPSATGGPNFIAETGFVNTSSLFASGMYPLS